MLLSFSLATLALLPAVLAQGLTVNTPVGVVQCEPTQITWTGGKSPYFLSFLPAGQSSAPPIKQFPTQSDSTFTWTADLAAGSSFTISLKDSSGTTVFSDIVTIQSGSNSGCINTSITETGTGGAAAPTSGGNSASAPGVTTSAASSAASSGAKPASSGSASATGSAASSSSSTKPNGASSNRGNTLAVAGVMGLVGAALF